jgi:hypothetical protein
MNRFFDTLPEDIREAAISSGLRHPIEKLFDASGRIEKWACKKVIEKSAWWTAHPLRPCHAPKDADRIEDSSNGWQVTFGSNCFCVERAIEVTILTVLSANRFVDELKTSHGGSEALRSHWELLYKALHCAVTRNDDDKLYQYPSEILDSKEFLLFGAHGIEVDSFYRQIFEWFKFGDHFDVLVRQSPWRKLAKR